MFRKHHPSVSTAFFAGLTLAAAAPASADAYDFEYQRPVEADRVSLNVAGPLVDGVSNGDLFLESVQYDGSELLDQFYKPSGISSFFLHPEHEDRISIRGGKNITDGVPGDRKFRVMANRRGAKTASAKQALFEQQINEVLQSDNINFYINTQYNKSNGMGNVMFDLVINFDDLPLLDNDPEPDAIGELLLFERGTGDGNSWLTLQAVDADGVALGPPLAVGTGDTHATNPPTKLYRNQGMGGVAIDLSRLGVTELSHLRIRSTYATDSGFVPNIGPGVDFEPDFKIFYIKTHPLHTRRAPLYD